MYVLMVDRSGNNNHTEVPLIKVKRESLSKSFENTRFFVDEMFHVLYGKKNIHSNKMKIKLKCETKFMLKK